MNYSEPLNLSNEEIEKLIKDIEQLSGSSKDNIDSIESPNISDYDIKRLLEEYEQKSGKEFDTDLEEKHAEGTYQLPLKGGQILSSFVTKEIAQKNPGAVASLDRHPEGHEAIDVMIPGFNPKTNTGKGAPVYPIGPGKVIKITSPSENIKGGITCTIQHTEDPGLISYYAHLSKLNVGVGSVVDKNTVIGLNGDTGSAKGTAPHVHLSTTLNGKKVNPLTDIIGKKLGSLTKEASLITSIYRTACIFEKLLKNI